MEVKKSGYEALLESLTKTLQIPKNVGQGASKSAGGIFGAIFNTVNNVGNMAAKQTSRVVNTGNWMFEKFPVIATVSSIVLFWKPIKNTFNKVLGRKDPQTEAYKREIKTMRESNPYYQSQEMGPRDGMRKTQWRDMVQASRGQYTGQDGSI